MPEPDLDQRKIRRLTEERLQSEKTRSRLSFFAASAFTLVLFAIISWGLLLSRNSSPDRDVFAIGLVLMTIAGLLGLLAQGMSIMLDTKANERALRERVYTTVRNEEMMGLGEDDDEEREKPKHMTRLTDDGELEEVIDDAAYNDAERKFQRK